MDKMKEVFNFIVGLIILVVILFYGFLFSVGLIRILSTLSTPVIVALVTGVVTVLGSVITIVVGKYNESKILVEQQIRDKKVPLYEDLLEFSFDLFSDKTMAPEELNKKFMKFTEKLIVWGTDDVVLSWSNFRKKAIYKNASPDAISSRDFMDSFAKVLLSIRKDVGHKNKKIEEETLLGLFIKDL